MGFSCLPANAKSGKVGLLARRLGPARTAGPQNDRKNLHGSGNELLGRGGRWRNGRGRRSGRRGAASGVSIEVEVEGRGELGHFGEDVRADIVGGKLRRATLVNEERDQANDGRGLDDGHSAGGKIKFEEGRAARGEAGGGKS